MSRATSLLAATFLGLGFVFTGPASSAPKQKKTVAASSVTNQKKMGTASSFQKQKKNKMAGNQSGAPLVQHLEAIRATLNKADHDYKGHRAAAVHQITHAIHLLQHGKQHANPGQHFVSGKMKEPQSASDAQLKQALAALQSVSVPASKHQAKVQAHIAKAVNDLGTALKTA